jgi:crotonobetainyl-CoA:carnitine CoA-transferase CaiB-like acyl-CoA transferase
MKITGEESGQPMKLGVAIVDIVTGLNAVISILSGLIIKNKKLKINESILTEVNLYNTGIFLLANVASNNLISNKESGRFGHGHPNIVPYNLFKTKDGLIALSVGNDKLFKKFSELIKKPEWYLNDKFKTNEHRVINRLELEKLIEVSLTLLTIAEGMFALINKSYQYSELFCLSETSINFSSSNLLITLCSFVLNLSFKYHSGFLINSENFLNSLSLPTLRAISPSLVLNKL